MSLLQTPHAATNPSLSKALKAALLSTILLSPLALSTEKEPTTWFGENADGEWLAGVKLSSVQPDLAGYDSATMGTLVLGYQFARPAGDRGRSSIELEIGASNTADISAGGTNHVAEYDMHTFGVFFNYRSPGTVYFKGKLGAIDSNIDTSYRDGSKALPKLNDTAFAFGLGLGVRVGQNATVEADWVSAAGDNDVNYYSLGGNIEF